MTTKTTEETGKKGLVDKVSAILSFVKDLGLICILLYGVYFTVVEFSNEEPIMEDIEVPKELAEKFSTNIAVTRQLLDAAAAISHEDYLDKSYPIDGLPNFWNIFSQHLSLCKDDLILQEFGQAIEEFDAGSNKKALTAAITKYRGQEQSCVGTPPIINIGALKPPVAKFELVPTQGKDADIQAPTVGSLRLIIRSLKQRFGAHVPPHITGEITKKNDGQIYLVLRSDDPTAVHPDVIHDPDMSSVIAQGGEILLELYAPCVAALHTYRKELSSSPIPEKREFDKTNQLIEPCRNSSTKFAYIADLLPGLIAKGQEKFNVAIEHYKKVENNDVADIYYYLGDALEAQSQRKKDSEKNALEKEAMENYEKAIQIDPGYTSAYLSLALLRASNTKSDINEHFRKLVDSSSPRMPDMYLLWGNALLQQGSPAEAIAKYTKAIELKPNHAVAHHNLGVALFSQAGLKKPDAQQVDFQKAIEQFTRAQKFDNRYSAAYYSHGIAETIVGNYKDAISLYNKAIELNSSLNNAYYFMGVANLRLKDADSALRDFLHFVEQNPQAYLPDVYIYMGNAYMILAKEKSVNSDQANAYRSSAIHYYEKAKESEPSYRYVAALNQSFAHALLGELGRAKDSYQEASRYKNDYFKIFANTPDVPSPPKQVSSEPPAPSSPLILPWVVGGIIMTSGILLLFFVKRANREKSQHVDDQKPSGFHNGNEPVTPIHPSSSFQEDTPLRSPRRTQTGGNFPPPSLQQPTAILHCVSGSMIGQQFAIRQEVINIGANSQNELCIPNDEFVSGHHARIRFEKGSLIISDTASRNGTFVNERRVSDIACAVMPGDRIQIGKTIFEVRLP